MGLLLLLGHGICRLLVFRDGVSLLLVVDRVRLGLLLSGVVRLLLLDGVGLLLVVGRVLVRLLVGLLGLLQLGGIDRSIDDGLVAEGAGGAVRGRLAVTEESQDWEAC